MWGISSHIFLFLPHLQAGMAVANALGANVQNVFLALAIPWTIQVRM